MGRRRAATVVIAFVLTGCASTRHHDPGTGGVTNPPRAVIAAAAPSSTTSDACLLPDASSARAGSRPATVGADPISVRAVWFRGLNATRCAEPITHAGARTAVLLAHDIRTATPYPPGRYNCPADFGRAVELYFAYSHRPTTETVVVTLTGCAGIVAPGRGPKLEPGRLIDDLRPITPPNLLRQSD